ncbi:COBRA-like protein 6 [Hibiscus syriacus]|uniref:COBRA-like protein 6 n=1 Tax=Hibiscus syriacus TaxID=106335 RepID=A0A6A2ZG57_HIBSY|nr:COBRA-like protein 6 [Hibiscus syriacus]
MSICLSLGLCFRGGNFVFVKRRIIFLLVKVSILNFQKYRHIEQPGWKLGWDWKGDEAIWNMRGAEATEQGNCSRFKGDQLPHCCERTPSIVDLLPGTPYNMQTTNCCKGDVLSSMIQDPSKYDSVFEMSVSGDTKAGFNMPENFTIGIQGYTCGHAVPVAPSKYSLDGRRWTQALGTWNVIYKNREPPSLVRCSKHMCPIWIHWHVKNSYTSYRRVKITVHNQNIVKNYSEWNSVALHPNLESVVQVFSFNYVPLSQYEFINDTGMFWGIKFYNDMLLQEGAGGNVQTEMLLQKDPGVFTFREGWGFPRRIPFNGDEYVMPPPDQYPRLPIIGQHDATLSIAAVFLSLLLLNAGFQKMFRGSDFVRGFVAVRVTRYTCNSACDGRNHGKPEITKNTTTTTI